MANHDTDWYYPILPVWKWRGWIATSDPKGIQTEPHQMHFKPTPLRGLTGPEVTNRSNALTWDHSHIQTTVLIVQRIWKIKKALCQPCSLELWTSAKGREREEQKTDWNKEANWDRREEVQLHQENKRTWLRCFSTIMAQPLPSWKPQSICSVRSLSCRREESDFSCI